MELNMRIGFFQRQIFESTGFDFPSKNLPEKSG